VREAAGIFDVSHLGKARVRGPGAAAFVNSCLTNDLGRIEPGKAQYTLCCDESGGVVDDLIAYLFADDHVFLIPNAANTAEVVRRLRAAAPAGVTVEDEHRSFAVLAVQGPSSAQVLGKLGLDASHNWLGSQTTALGALMLVTIWKEAGFFMIFYLAALQGISPSLAEAAALEGASRWAFFRRVQFPLLMPTTLFVLINAVIGAFRTVDHIIVMTRGGPDNATTLLLYYIYQVGFNFWDTSYSAALTGVMLAMLAALALLQYGVLERRIHYR